MSNEKPSSPIKLPAAVSDMLGRVKATWFAFSRPARVLMASTLVFAIAIGGFFTYRGSHETYAVLFSQLEQDDAGALVAKLKELKVPYRVGADGATIEVPEAQVHELRLDLASAGLPRGGGVGFESFDKMRLGATEFEQRVLYRRALEGELSRTIGTIAAVQSARVHLVLPEKSVFVAHAEPASASLVVRLRPGRTMGGSEVAGVVHLVASSVPGLTADHVALVTTEGVMLHRPRQGGAAGTSDDDADNEHPSQEKAVETALEERTRSMLEKLVGAGHVDVRVTADVDSARVERVEDHYDPSHSVLRSEEQSTDRSGSGIDAMVAGVPGAESNLPSGALNATKTTAGDKNDKTKPGKGAKPGDKATAEADPATALLSAPVMANTGVAGKAGDMVRESHTRNFEIDHVSEKRIALGGTLRRIGVAVILDGIAKTENGHTTMVPRSHEDLEHIAALVKSAVGANDARGDVVTVDSIPFLDGEIAAQPVEATPAPLPFEKYRKFAPAAGGAAALLLASLFAWRLIAAKKSRGKRDLHTEAFKLASIPTPAQIEAIIAEPSNPVDVRAAAIDAATRDPATAALVLRFWLGAAENDVKVGAAAH